MSCVSLATPVAKTCDLSVEGEVWRDDGGQGVTAAATRGCEDENQRLKKLEADLSLDKYMLKEVIEKTGGARRAVERRVCELIGVA